MLSTSIRNSQTFGLFSYSMIHLQRELRRKIHGTTNAFQQKAPNATQPDKDAPSSNVLVEKDSNITLIGINREQTRNSIDAATAQQLRNAFHTFEADDESPVAVLYGVGGNFCAGYDVKELEQQVEEGSLDFLVQREGSVGPTRRHLQKPVVCGINGFCVANGLELALLCDLRVMEDTAVLGFFNRRFGVPLSDGGTVRLAASVGYARALDLITTGRRVTASEALSMGLINRYVATGTALGQAVHLAYSLAKFASASLQHDRKSLYSNVYDNKGFHVAIENEIMYTSKEVVDEIREGVIKFRSSEKKGARADSWRIKDKPIPEWEKQEIAFEEQQVK